MRNLVLIKHSLPEISYELPARQWPLSAEGQRRCKKLAPLLDSFQFDQIYCSHEPKATDTAQILADCLSISVLPVDGLHEHDRSNQMIFDTQEKFEESIHRVFERPCGCRRGTDR